MSSRRNLLETRLKDQKEACENIFNQLHFECCEPEYRLNVDCYYLKIDDLGEPRITDLAKYLADMLTQYVHSLAVIVEAYESKNPRDFQRLSRDAVRLLVSKSKQGDLGEFILWMMKEGILQVPKVITKHGHKTNTNMQNFGSDGVHASFDHQNNELILYIGESKLRSNIKQSVTAALSSIYDHFGVKNGKRVVDQDIYLLDQFAMNDINDEKLVAALKDFAKPDSKVRANTKYTICVFTGYDSKTTAQLKNIPFSKMEDHIKTLCLGEVQSLANHIKTEFSLSPINKYRVVWFMLPFSNIKEFETTFVAETRGEYL
ncbi:hypothetical protein Back11_38400 [Paenibacillus baekrokdamisoli]|uniref:Anti-bacteriophage protein A/HamA C-terminal domain-containing protein n=1 Tax=Paenibacillus baekrokdamisoli TaxID=1712516 RepID=A0A3G9J2A3_9BACL|nr:DUF1837 domain-containing protein [Paenibacillus baekrokdamisoli]MBB3068463.1 hypothetical protein [Paenibacillus baekrokdamisoli]BBH22495.1 hypothetical protein Back11_38400 [Paenibacillus baekrokdamisoli]